MLKRILLIWFTANFILVGIASGLAGSWYLGWPRLPGLLAELGLIMLPNLLLPFFILRRVWPAPVPDPQRALGWRWNGWRSIAIGAAAFAGILILEKLINLWVGESIPYEVPGKPPLEANNLPAMLALLFGLLVFIFLTVAGEETMFRGLIQTQIGDGFSPWTGLLLAAVLFGLRHLPADLFYASVWKETPQMWLSRQLQLYSAALLLGLARHFGRSTYAPAITHGLMLVQALFGL